MLTLAPRFIRSWATLLWALDTASIKGVLSELSRESIFAPLSNRVSTISVYPLEAAICNGELFKSERNENEKINDSYKNTGQ